MMGLIRYADTIYSRNGVNQSFILENDKELFGIVGTSNIQGYIQGFFHQYFSRFIQ